MLCHWVHDYKTALTIHPYIELLNGFNDDLFNNIKPYKLNLLIVDDLIYDTSSCFIITKRFN